MSAVATCQTRTAPSLVASGGFAGLYEAFVLTLRSWHELARGRRALARLSPEQLRDVGLDAETARMEADRPFWDAPGWMR